MIPRIRRSLAVGLACASALAGALVATAQHAAADGPGCASVGGNGICLSGPGLTVGGETVGPVTAGGQTVSFDNPLPVSVCYVVGCLTPGQPITLVNVPSETVPGETVPTVNVPITPETQPMFAVLAQEDTCNCMTPTFGIYELPVAAPNAGGTIEWGDGGYSLFAVYPEGVQVSHTYPGTGTYVASIRIGNNAPVWETVVCAANGCHL